MKNDDKLIFNSYAYTTGTFFLNESDQAEAKQQVTKQKFVKQLEDPKVQQAMLQQAEALKTKYQEEINKALEQDGGTAGSNVEALLTKIQQELESQAKQQVKESTELQEGFLKRYGALASGIKKRVGDVLSNNPSDKGFRQEAILKRFNTFKNSIGSEIRELQRDMETTSNIDTRVKDAVNKTIGTMETRYGFAPTSSKFQDFRHAAGKFTQNVLTGATLAAPIVALAAPIATAMGLAGAAGAAVTAGMTGGSVSMLKDLITGQKPDVKRAAITGLASAATAGLFKMAIDHFSGAQEVVPGSDIKSNIQQAKPALDNPEMGRLMHGPSGLDPSVAGDQLKQTAQDVLWKQGIIGKGGSDIAIPSPAIQNYIDKLIAKSPEKAKFVIDYIKDMPRQDARVKFSWDSRQSGAAVKALQSLVNKSFGGK